jgi:divinyl protochlorophyllide a 8-vinyl-reductase
MRGALSLLTAPDSAPVGAHAVVHAAAALKAAYGPVATRWVFERAGLSRRLDCPPDATVPEREVTRLHLALRAVLGPEGARAVAREAGLRTAEQVCATGLAVPVRLLLRLLPARGAARLLLALLRRRAPDLAGSGRLRISGVAPLHVEIAGCQVCRATLQDSALGAYYAAVFERLFQRLVDPTTMAVEERRSHPDGVVRFALRRGHR